MIEANHLAIIGQLYCQIVVKDEQIRQLTDEIKKLQATPIEDVEGLELLAT